MQIKIKEIIEKYTTSVEFKSLSLNSKKTYDLYLNRLKTKVGEETLSGGLNTMQNDVALLNNVVLGFKGPQGKRMARRVFVLLLKWANAYSLLPNNPAVHIPLAKLTGKDRNPFNIDDIHLISKLFFEQDVLPNLYKPYVAQALVAFHTGMRPSELDKLLWEDVGDEFINVRSAKHNEVGAVARMVRVTSSVARVLNQRDKGLVFKSMTGKQLNKDTRSEAIHYTCTKVGIKPREFYSTRRGTATEMFKAGYDIAAIQHQLGHRNIATTQIYIKPTLEQAASVFRGF